MEKAKNYILICLFALLLLGFGAAFWILPDKDLSESERRALAQAPVLDLPTFFSGDFANDLEDYLLDQFPLRESFRSLNSIYRLYLMGQQDVNGLWTSDGSIFKEEFPLDKQQAEYGANIINTVYETYLQGMDVYYSVIPDKNYFAAEDNGHMALDYDLLVELMNSNVDGPQYVDIFPLLSLEDYYRTDTHWRQDRIHQVASALAEAMGAGEHMVPISEYESHELYPFKGVYLGQSALPVRPDTITYLTSQYTDSSTVTGLELDGEAPVYMLDRFQGLDGYDVFLGGAQALLTIECPNANTDKELIIFRDSFGSSIAPLFLGAYSKVTLVDLRYIPTALLGEYVDFVDQDVLFLYSSLLLNSSMLMK